ncbi:MAG TPA: alpha/beta fold hydrolase [Thermoanaerobaculia bacterium]|nr:alpha/beta fold hydrolase [Thermoanaerobaculia bacterium]
MIAADVVAAIIQQSRAALASAGMERREFNGTVYWIGGRAEARPTLVLLHGVNDQAGTFAAVVPALLKKYCVVIPDLPGHGESEPKQGPIAMSVVMERVSAIIDHEHLGCFTLAGNSFGGWIAILYALAHPDRVASLLLEDGGGLARPPGVPFVATDRETAERILRAVHGPNYVAPDWAIEALYARAKDSPLLRLTGLFDYFVDARLKELHVPTTIVWGEHDGVVPFSYIEALQDGIANSKLRVIKDAGHIPHAQQPEQWLSCLTEISSPSAHE